MKKIILILSLIFISFSSHSQEAILLAKYQLECSLNYSEDVYNKDCSEGWYDCKITVYEDYGIFEEDGKEIKIFWQLDLEASTEEMIVFWAEDNEAKIVFFSNNDEVSKIEMYVNYNETFDRYEDFFRLTKISVL